MFGGVPIFFSIVDMIITIAGKNLKTPRNIKGWHEGILDDGAQKGCMEKIPPRWS